MKALLSDLRSSLMLTLVFVVLLCGVYPLAVWGGGTLLFRGKAEGSLVTDAKGTVVGSTLLAQGFTLPKYFHPRQSVAGNGYDATNSSGTNLGPTSDKLANGVHAKDAAGKAIGDPGNFDGIKDLVAAYREENGLAAGTPVPADAVTRSASGLDPHISVANALLQADRVAKARGIALEAVIQAVGRATEGRDWGVFGEAGVNVLRLNLDLDALGSPKKG